MSIGPSVKRIRGERDECLQARVISRHILKYADGADEREDRPAHVRAASGLAWIGTTLVIPQDDANFVALFDVPSGTVQHIALPANAEGQRLFDVERGNKAAKSDFEAIVSHESEDESIAILFGSGSTASREAIAIIRFAPVIDVQIIRANTFYAALRDARGFAGSELNVEGALLTGTTLRLFGRGNGSESEGVRRIDATCDIGWESFRSYLRAPHATPAPGIHNVIQYDLGQLDGTRVSFTDACVADRMGNVLFTGTAEASADVVLDGPVTGSVIGLISVVPESVVRWTPITERDGSIVQAKIEGIARSKTDPDMVFVVVDSDDHKSPGELWEIELIGFSV